MQHTHDNENDVENSETETSRASAKKGNMSASTKKGADADIAASAQFSILELMLWLGMNSANAHAASQSPIALPDPQNLAIPENFDAGWSSMDSSGQSFVPPTTDRYISQGQREQYFRDSTRENYGNYPSTGQHLDNIRTSEHTPVDDGTWNKFLDQLVKREGYSSTAYHDSRGHLTIGVGHLVLAGDGQKLGFGRELRAGDKISHDQVRDMLGQDAQKSYLNAIDKANELGVNDENLVVTLASMNYQLGENWHKEHKKTWAYMKNGNFEMAARQMQNSNWFRQTPTRVRDAQIALMGVDKDESASHGFAVASLKPEFEQQATATEATTNEKAEPSATENEPGVIEQAEQLASAAWGKMKSWVS